MTFLAALRHDRLEAPWLLAGPLNGETFRLYVEKVLVPTLRPGDIVVAAWKTCSQTHRAVIVRMGGTARQDKANQTTRTSRRSAMSWEHL